ncbi:hypothetical protein [Streptomyces cellulosae]|uniref:Uncharacterized protein n=1 Tax=Streptomyces cellulosae TaxID=1968 RepID=A0ABW7Y8T2_STRCE
MRADIVIRQLEKALERLAWDAEKQIDFISRLRVGVDELALEFDDAFRPVSGLTRDGTMPKSVTKALDSVDKILTEMTRSPEAEWTPTAVRNSQSWKILRNTARESLNLLREVEIDIDSSSEE